MFAESLIQTKLSTLIGALERRVIKLEETAILPAAPIAHIEPVAVVNVAVNERKPKTVFTALPTLGIRTAIGNGHTNPSGQYLQEGVPEPWCPRGLLGQGVAIGNFEAEI